MGKAVQKLGGKSWILGNSLSRISRLLLVSDTESHITDVFWKDDSFWGGCSALPKPSSQIQGWGSNYGFKPLNLLCCCSWIQILSGAGNLLGNIRPTLFLTLRAWGWKWPPRPFSFCWSLAWETEVSDSDTGNSDWVTRQAGGLSSWWKCDQRRGWREARRRFLLQPLVALLTDLGDSNWQWHWQTHSVGNWVTRPIGN